MFRHYENNPILTDPSQFPRSRLCRLRNSTRFGSRPITFDGARSYAIRPMAEITNINIKIDLQCRVARLQNVADENG